MTIKTAVTFPKDPKVVYDSEGFETIEPEWSAVTPANVRDSTNTEKVKAYQGGYDVDRVFNVLAATYNGSAFLKDETDGYIYDIERVYNAAGTKALLLECKRRNSGLWRY